MCSLVRKLFYCVNLSLDCLWGHVSLWWDAHRLYVLFEDVVVVCCCRCLLLLLFSCFLTF